MRELLISLELKHADLLVRERMLRNSNISHPFNERNLRQIQRKISTLETDRHD